MQVFCDWMEMAMGMMRMMMRYYEMKETMRAG